MKQTSQLRRGRSRPGQGRKGPGQNRHNQNRHNQNRQNPGRVKQQATQAMEKYLNLFREARISGDRIDAENYRQHADHYFRVLAEANAQLAEMQDSKVQQPAEEKQNKSSGNEVEAPTSSGEKQEQSVHKEVKSPTEPVEIPNKPENKKESAEGQKDALVKTEKPKPKPRTPRKPKAAVQPSEAISTDKKDVVAVEAVTADASAKDIEKK